MLIYVTFCIILKVNYNLIYLYYSDFGTHFSIDNIIKLNNVKYVTYCVEIITIFNIKNKTLFFGWWIYGEFFISSGTIIGR